MVSNYFVCAIKDNALNSFSTPFFTADLRESQRRFDLFACDLNQKVYINNFGLYHLGKFDSESASFDLIEPVLLQRNDEQFYSRFNVLEVK